MPINRSYIGRVYPPSPAYEVGREKIREFADAIGDLNPAYRDADAARALGHPDVIAPPTFAIVMSLDIAGQAVTDPELGVDYSRVVHGEQQFSHVRPIVAGDRLVGTLCITDIKSAGRNELLTTEVVIATEDGEAVTTAITTLVVRGGAA